MLLQQAPIDAAGGTPTETERRTIAQRRLELAEGDNGFSPLRGPFSRPLIVLMAMAGVILPIACANLANLLPAGASVRRRGRRGRGLAGQPNHVRHGLGRQSGGALLTAIPFGPAPALRATRLDVNAAL